MQIHKDKKTDMQAEFAKIKSAQERFDYYMSHPYAHIDKEMAQALAGTHVVLIAGLGAEFVKAGENMLKVADERRYFGKLKENLEKAGATVTVRHPRSVEIEDSADAIIKDARKLYRKGKNKPLVLLGHSRGGMVAVETLLRAPHLLKDGIILKAATLQSPINGHHYTGSPLVAGVAEGGLGFLKAAGNLGLRPLVHQNIHKLFDAKAFQKQLSPVEQKLVSDSILYFTGTSDKVPLLPLLAGPTDGLVPLRNQRRKEYGFVAACFNKVNHLDAVVEMPHVSTRAPSEALALTVMEVLAKSISRGPEWDGMVAEAEEKRIRMAMKKQPPFKLPKLPF